MQVTTTISISILGMVKEAVSVQLQKVLVTRKKKKKRNMLLGLTVINSPSRIGFPGSLGFEISGKILLGGKAVEVSCSMSPFAKVCDERKVQRKEL